MAEALGTEPKLSHLSSSAHPVDSPYFAIPRVCSLSAALVALVVLAGWSLHAYALVTVLPNLPAMAQSTAAAFLLVSVSLWILGGAALDDQTVRIGQVVSVCALLVGVATLLHYGLSLFDPKQVVTTSTGRPINQMSPNSALNFVLIGAALFLIDVRGRGDRWPAQVLALIVALDALVALVGQIYGVTFLYGLSHYLGMAIHTAILFFILSVGLLLARPHRGFVAIVLADDAAGRAARRFLPLALIAPVVLGGVSFLGQRLRHTDAPFLAYLLVVISVGLLGWLIWGNVLALSAQVHRSQSYERQVADLERGRVEDALAASEQRLLFAVEGAGIGTWAWDMGTDHLIWSPRCKALFGLPSETQMTRSLFYGRIHPEDRDRAEVTIAHAQAEGSTYDIEYRVLWLDGTVHWIAAKGRGYNDVAGSPVRFEGTLQDIDARKAAEETLRDAAERQKALLRDVLLSVTGGRLRLVESEADLPPVLSQTSEPILLTPSEGLRTLRQRAKEAAVRAGYGDERWQDLVTGASESGMNAVTHGGGRGEAQVSSDGIGIVQIRVQDWGAGINMENLPKAALSRGWSSTASLGHGLVMILQSVDRFWLLTGPEGTTVVMEQDREEPPPAWL